ncbi:hypothetical protein HY494_01580 [Candidatus Woesearchaeota archaeon]|nr:hypothetical protein [Candidatus Woesearchaeota archaeon]
MTQTKHAWKKETRYNNGIKFTRPTAQKIALDLGLKAAGAIVMYGLGKLVGEGMDYVPYLNEWIPRAIDYVSGIDVKGNLDGLVVLMGAVDGLNRSGTETFEDDYNRLETIELSPIKFTVKK